MLSAIFCVRINLFGARRARTGRYPESTGASAVFAQPSTPSGACLIWRRYRATSRTLTFPAALCADKGLLQVQSMSKTTGNTLHSTAPPPPPGATFPYGPCSCHANAENAALITWMEQLLATKGNRGFAFECITRR